LGRFVVFGVVIACWLGATAIAGVGDPQIKTDHPWYQGELSCSTFERLRETQAELYLRVTGREARSDEDRVLAAWLWRNTHYWHGTEGAMDLWSTGFTGGPDMATRDYWTGLFSHGCGLCGTTHAQWCAEMNELLGHGRARVGGVEGHNSFEVFLTGGAYGKGRWALLDHDLSTVIFSPDGSRLLSLDEVVKDFRRLTDRNFDPDRQRGWLVSGLDARDGSAYSRYQTAEYLAGYAGPPPMVHLRRGETLRRYVEPGLDDGKTFVFWGINAHDGTIPGPSRGQTWVNQPEKMFESKVGTPFRPGQARYANAVFTYRPDFSSFDYREGVVGETDDHLDFEFNSPFVIAATPPNDKPWGIYDSGCRNGLVLRGSATCDVSMSVDRGATWRPAGKFREGLDLTDYVKGSKQYRLRFHAAAKSLARSNLSMTTVCQMNSSVIPRLRDGGTEVTFAASGRTVDSIGPNKSQAQPSVVDGAFDSPRVTLRAAATGGGPIVEVHAAAHVKSSNPPDPAIAYQIEYSVDDGRSWSPIVRDWRIERRTPEPGDFWSQSFCWGHVVLKPPTGQPTSHAEVVLVRFRNNGGKQYARAEVHLVCQPKTAREATRVTFGWTEAGEAKQASHVFATGSGLTWHVPTGKNVRARWVEMAAVTE
jgi:hypothetical protein